MHCRPKTRHRPEPHVGFLDLAMQGSQACRCLTYCAWGDSGFKGRDPGSTGGCDFPQRTIALPSLTSGMYPISRFSVSTVSECGSFAMSGPGTAGVATVGVGDNAALDAAAPTASARVPGGSCGAGTAGGGGGEAAAVIWKG